MSVGFAFSSDGKTTSGEDRTVRQRTFREVSGNALAFGDLRGSRRIASAFCLWIQRSVVINPFQVSGHALAFGDLRGSRRIASAFRLCGYSE